MARVLKIASGLTGVLLLVMVGVMGAGRYGKEGPELIVFTYLDENQPMVGWVTADFQRMRRLGNRCETYSDFTIYRPDENWLYVHDCPHPARGGWTVKRIHIITGVEDIIATKMVPYSGRWSPDKRWFVFQELQERNTDHIEVEWVRVAPDGSQRVVLTENIPVPFWPAEERPVYFLPDSDWVRIIRDSFYDLQEDDDIYQIRIDGKEWENLTANVGDPRSWLRAQASGLKITLTSEMLKTALGDGVSTLSPPSICHPGDASQIIAELPTKHLKVITEDWSTLRGVSTLDGSVLWEAPYRNQVQVSPDEEWVFLVSDNIFVYEFTRWDGSDYRRLVYPFEISDFWSPDLKWLVYRDWDRCAVWRRKR